MRYACILRERQHDVFLQLEAIERTKVNVSVYLGNYAVPTDGGASYIRQRDTIKEALQTYGADHVLGVTVGNEYMLKCVPVMGNAHRYAAALIRHDLWLLLAT